eukprot:4966755-Lingulodinium_polyedra.AAC.1
MRRTSATATGMPGGGARWRNLLDFCPSGKIAFGRIALFSELRRQQEFGRVHRKPPIPYPGDYG